MKTKNEQDILGANGQIASLFEAFNDFKNDYQFQTTKIGNRMSLVEKDVNSLSDGYKDLSKWKNELNKRLDTFEISQINQNNTVNNIESTMTEFIKAHKEDAPKAIKAMKALTKSMIGSVLFIAGMVIGFIAYQNDVIQKLQNKNTEIIMKLVENNRKALLKIEK